MKLMDIIKEYEKGELEQISKQSTQNISKEPIKPKSIDNKKTKPIGTNTKVVDAAAKVVGAGSKSLLKEPKKLSDFVMQMRAQIPDLDNLIQKNPRFIQTVRSISGDAANQLTKISKDTIGVNKN